jgi:hypothetical protein
MMGDGRRVMLYQFTEMQGFTGTVFGGGNVKTTTQKLQIMLNKDNVVDDYEFADAAPH